MICIYLDDDQFEYFHSGASGMWKDAIDNLVERLRLIGHEAFVLPNSLKLQIIDGDAPQTPVVQSMGDFRFMVVNVDVGFMPPHRARDEVARVRDEMLPQLPAGVKAFFFARSPESKGASITTFSI